MKEFPAKINLIATSASDFYESFTVTTTQDTSGFSFQFHLYDSESDTSPDASGVVTWDDTTNTGSIRVAKADLQTILSSAAIKKVTASLKCQPGTAYDVEFAKGFMTIRKGGPEWQ